MNHSLPDLGRRHPDLGEPNPTRIGSGQVRVFERGSGEPIVLVHGAMVNANLWRRVVPLLVSRFRVVTLDLPFGSHDRPVERADLTPPGIASMIIETMETLQLGGATLLANDTGGAIAQLIVAKRPDLIGRLALTSSDAYADFPPAAFGFMRAAAALPGGLLPLLTPMRSHRLRRLPFAQGWLTRRPLPPTISDSYLLPAILDRRIRKDLARVLVGLRSKHTMAAAERFREFERPVLVAWSRQDRFCPIANARRLVREFPDARLEWVEDAYTLSPEDQPERVAALVSHFVSTTEPGITNVR